MKIVLTLIVIFGGDGKHGMLNVFIFVDLSLVEAFVEVWWIVVFVGNTNTDEFCDCNINKSLHIT